MTLNTKLTHRPARDDRHGRDGGFTLIELLVGMVVTGMMITAMTLSFTTFLRTYPQAVNRVAVSKDVMFVQAWLPIDLASATEINTDPLFQPATTQALDGTNVMAITRQDLQQAGHPLYYVNYRYQLVGGEWVLVRYEIRNPGSTDPANPESVSIVGIAHQLAQPDADPTWDPTKPPTFAISVQDRLNKGDLRKAAQDVKVKFIDGTSYNTGGAGLGPGELLTDVTNNGFVNPKSPPSRCGGRITLLLDTSGSLASRLSDVKAAAKDFVDAFQGTPTQMRIVEFDAVGKPVSPSTWNGLAIDMLNLDGPGKDAVKAQITGISENTGGTNWEDGLRIAMTDFSQSPAITPSPSMPDTVVFFTDGEPYNYIDNSGVSRGSSDLNFNVNEAKTISAMQVPWAVSIKGVFVQNGGQTTGNQALTNALNRMREIVGNDDWNPGPVGPDGKATVGDAATAGLFFSNDFAELSNIFHQIFVSDCGGTVTVQRRENGSPTDPVTSGSYDYSAGNGVGTLRAASANSITFDYELDSGSSQWVEIVEQGASGDDIVDVRCYHNGNEVPDRVQKLYELDPVTGLDVEVTSGRLVKVVANEALSCLFIGG